MNWPNGQPGNEIDSYFLVVADSNDGFRIPTNIAACADCSGPLYAVPNQIGKLEHNDDVFKVGVPTLYCENDDQHGDRSTTEWFNTYDVVSKWFLTIVVKLRRIS